MNTHFVTLITNFLHFFFLYETDNKMMNWKTNQIINKQRDAIPNELLHAATETEMNCLMTKTPL